MHSSSGRNEWAFRRQWKCRKETRSVLLIVEKNGLELMYQSFASAEKDNAATGAAARKGPSFLYIEVADLDAALAATKGAEMVMPMRTTFYQPKEFGVKDPAGHYVIFAQQGAAAQERCSGRPMHDGANGRSMGRRAKGWPHLYCAAEDCYICR